MIGQKVFLRAVELNDVDTLYSFENDVSIWHLSDTLMPFSHFAMEQYVIESAAQDIYTAKQLRLIICETASKHIVGTIDLYDFNPTHKRAGVGILIAEKYRKNGYATEALQLMISYAFSTLQLKQLYCSITSNNVTSLNLFQKLGFIQTGMFKSWRYYENNYLDECFLQLISIEK